MTFEWNLWYVFILELHSMSPMCMYAYLFIFFEVLILKKIENLLQKLAQKYKRGVILPNVWHPSSRKKELSLPINLKKKKRKKR